MKLIVATNNLKKRREIESILAGAGIELVDLADTIAVEVVEDADSFAGNARKKAEAFAKANHLPALADDSGLCVDALDGAPGIYSSRFSGMDSDDAANNKCLLKRMHGLQNRSAHFCCAIHLAYPDQRAGLTAEGRVDGLILASAAGGSQGFGYDPLFFCPELGKVFAEATSGEKASVSHRGRALNTLFKLLSPEK